MGTARATFAGDRAGDRTIAHDRKWRDRKWSQSHDRKWRQSRALSGSMFCACATGNGTISALVGPFDRKWQSHVTGSVPVRKRSWPEVCPAHAPFSPAFFFLVVVTGLPDVTPFGVLLLCACASGSCATSVVTWPLRKCHCGVLYDVRVL
jgi:hypothetical protein